MKVFSFLFLILMGFSLPVAACPVCFSAEGGTLNAFRFSTVFLTLVPLILFGSFGYWYFRQVKKQHD